MFGDMREWISREVGGWVDGVWLEGRTDGQMGGILYDSIYKKYPE